MEHWEDACGLPVGYSPYLENRCLGGWLGFLTQLLKMLDHFSCFTLFHCRDILTLYLASSPVLSSMALQYLVFHGSPSLERRVRCYPLTEDSQLTPGSICDAIMESLEWNMVEGSQKPTSALAAVWQQSSYFTSQLRFLLYEMEIIIPTVQISFFSHAFLVKIK